MEPRRRSASAGGSSLKVGHISNGVSLGLASGHSSEYGSRLDCRMVSRISIGRRSWAPHTGSDRTVRDVLEELRTNGQFVSYAEVYHVEVERFIACRIS